MPESLITRLRHVELAVPDLARQREFFTGTWGLAEQHTDGGLSFLAAEGSPEQYVVRLRESSDKCVDLLVQRLRQGPVRRPAGVIATVCHRICIPSPEGPIA